MESLEQQTLKCLLERSVALFAARPALSLVGGTPLTYGQLGFEVRALAEVLHGRGIRRGDRVAILADSSPRWGVAYFAITTMGAVAVPILPDFHANEVQHILRHSGARAAFLGQRQFAKLEEADLPDLRTLFLIDDFSLVPPATPMDRFQEILQEGQREFTRLKEAALAMAQRPPADVGEEDIASIIYTSGTTGHAKGVVLRHRNLVFDAVATLGIQDVGCEDRFLSVLPMSHSYECTIGFLIPMMQGASVYYLDRPPVPRVLLPALERVKPTMMLTVPLIMEKLFKTTVLPRLTGSALRRRLYQLAPVRRRLHRMAAAKIHRLFGGQLRFFGIGGALLAPDVEQFLRDGGFPYAIGYGLTETSPLVAGCSPAVTRYRATGVVIPGVEVRLEGADGTTGEGEIWVRGRNVMQGYYRDPERTAEVLTADGWFRTGDLGAFDRDGYLYIKGRLKNMILGASGENIYPEEIEAVINRSDLVMESLVYQDGGQLVARVHPNYEAFEADYAGQGLTESQLATRISARLESLRTDVNLSVSGFCRVSRFIEQPEPFEKTPTRKIKRYLYVD